MTQHPLPQPPSSATPAGTGPGLDPAPAAPSIGRTLTKWFLRASVIGFTGSLLIHAALLLTTALIGVSTGGGALPGEHGSGDVELAIATESELTAIEAANLESSAPLIVEQPDAGLKTDIELDVPALDDQPGSGSGLGDIAEGAGGAGEGVGEGGEGEGLGGAGGGNATFFGVEARGARFAYIVDVSGSMRGEKLIYLKQELNESIRSMLEHMSFYVVFFESQAIPIGNRTKWVGASDAGKKFAADEIAAIESRGGTMPWTSFEVVLAMKPLPDAIYFMTDGQFDPVVADQIAAAMRSGRKVPIHCITFVDKGAEELMRKIASDSGGTYTHIQGPRP